MSVSVSVLGFNGEQNVRGVENVLAALQEAGYSPNVTIRLNGEEIAAEEAASTPVHEGDTVVAAAPNLKGGR